MGTNDLKKQSIILRREKVMLPSLEGTISFRLLHRNLMEGWREMGGDGERGAEGTGKGVKKGGRVGERRREGVKRKRWRREEGGSEEEEMEEGGGREETRKDDLSPYM